MRLRCCKLVDRHLSKKSLPPAAAHSTRTCENRHFLTAHLVTSTRMALCRPGAFVFPGRLPRPRCRSPPPSVQPKNLNGGKADGNYHQLRRAAGDC